MNNFPAHISLTDRPVLIIGGGQEALAKARLMLAAKAKLTLIAQQFSTETQRELQGVAKLFSRDPIPADIKGAVLVFVADEEESRARRWVEIANIAGVLINVVDHPDLCDFTTPSIIDRGQVTVSISTGGAAPVLGRKLRTDIETMLPPRFGDLAEFANRYRDAVKTTIPGGKRRLFWETFFQGPIAAQVLEGDEPGAAEAMLELLNRPQTE